MGKANPSATLSNEDRIEVLKHMADFVRYDQEPQARETISREREAKPQPTCLDEASKANLEKWERQVQELDDPEFEENEEGRKQSCEEFGFPYYSPFCLKFGGPDSGSCWVDAFADFLDGVAAAPLSVTERDYVLECMGDARTFIERYENDQLPEIPERGESADSVI